MGRAGRARRRLPPGRLDGAGAAPRDARRRHLRLPLRHRPASRSRRAAGRPADAGGVRGLRGGAGPAAAAPRDGPVRGRPPARRGPPDPPAAPVARPARGRGLGEPPRQLLPRPARRRPGLARGRPGPLARRGPGLRRRHRERAGGLSDAVRAAVWAYAVGLSTNPLVTQRITEWQPTSLHDIPGILFFASALAVVVLIARRGRTTPWPTLLWLATFFVIGVYAIRGVAWWPLAAVPAIAGTLLTEPATDGGPDDRNRPAIRALNALLVGLIVLAGVALLPVWRPIDPGLGAPVGVVGNAPPGITAALRDAIRPGDRVFNPQPWGSWFEFALPTLPVALDSRIELFPVEVWDDYERVVAGVGRLAAAARRLGRDRRGRGRRRRGGLRRSPAGRRLDRHLRRRRRDRLPPPGGLTTRIRTRPGSRSREYPLDHDLLRAVSERTGLLESGHGEPQAGSRCRRARWRRATSACR